MTNEEQVDNIDRQKSMLTFFLLFFPSLLIALVPSIVDGNIIWPIIFKMLLLFYQAIALKNFVSTHYDE